MTIAVDFDGTIVEHRYPEIGKERPFAIATLKRLQKERHLLILWSVREGKRLQEAVDYCRERGLEFYAVNSNDPDSTSFESSECGCRKVNADIYIDDRSIGGLPDWGVIYQMIHNHWTYDEYLEQLNNEERDAPTLFQRLFGRK